MPTPQITKAYLLGLLHDATERKTTFRIATKNFLFARRIKAGIRCLGRNAWLYREGKNRNLWIVEFSKSVLAGTEVTLKQAKIDYLRGYFDAEGGIAKNKRVRYYLYFCQKNGLELKKIREILMKFGVSCGVLHNPSKKADPNYWRFFIRAKSYEKFASLIGSVHPEKQKYLRMKI